MLKEHSCFYTLHNPQRKAYRSLSRELFADSREKIALVASRRSEMWRLVAQATDTKSGIQGSGAGNEETFREEVTKRHTEPDRRSAVFGTRKPPSTRIAAVCPSILVAFGWPSAAWMLDSVIINAGLAEFKQRQGGGS
jgi:hypothetical protein